MAKRLRAAALLRVIDSTSWNIFGSYSAKSRHRNSAGARVEHMEQRAMMSTYTVTSTADDSSGQTLRDMVAAANADPGSTITFDGSIAFQTITLTQGQLEVSASTTIDATNESITISGGGTSRVFQVDAGTSVSISGLTITGGYAANGGAISNSGLLTLTADTFAGNTATAKGGAIYTSGGSLTIGSTAFSSDYAPTGGAIFSSAAGATISSTAFNGNSANVGAAIYTAYTSATFSLTACTISNNTGSAAAICDINSPMLLNQCLVSGNTGTSGNGAMLNDSNVTITNSKFYSNAGGLNAGAIYQVVGNLNVTNSEFIDNSVALNHYGGSAIEITGSTNANIINDTFTDNSFGGGNTAYGAVVVAQYPARGNIVNCIFWNDDNYNSTHPGSEYFINWADSYGATGLNVSFCNVRGGYGNYTNINRTPGFVQAPDLGNSNYGDLNLTTYSNCINMGYNGSVPPGTLTDIDGHTRIVAGTVDLGAHENQVARYYVDGAATGGRNNGSNWDNAFLTVQQALTAAQSATSPVLIVVGQGTYTPGTTRTATYQLTNNTTILGGFSGTNTADPDARDITNFATILSGDIGTIGNPADNVYHVLTASSSINNSSVLDGLIIKNGNANGTGDQSTGGGLLNAGSPTITNCTFSSNAAISGGGIYNAAGAAPTLTATTITLNTATDGAGMYNLNSNLSLSSDMFTGNIATDAGGAIYDSGGNPSIDSTFTGNQASFGGAVANTSGTTGTFNGTFTGNIATSLGGAIYNTGSSPTIDGTFEYNHAASGGAIASVSNPGGVTIRGGYQYNSASSYGGGAYSSNTPINIGAEFDNNTAAYGGGIANFNSSGTINGGFDHNTATAMAGGMYNYNSSITGLSASPFTFNVASTGGAIANVGPSANLTFTFNAAFLANHATGNGGAIYNSQGSITFTAGNWANSNTAGQGAFLYATAGGNISLNDVQIQLNTATATAGAIYSNANLTLTHAYVFGNTAASGAGAIQHVGGTLKIVNSVFVQNQLSTSSYGAGAINISGSGTFAIVNDSLSDNSFGGNGNGAVLVVSANATGTITNSIFWNDDAYNSTHPGNEYIVGWANNYGAGSPSVTYCDVRGGFSGVGNINVDPKFTSSSDLSLIDSSDCINAGSNAAIPPGTIFDFTGKTPRIVGSCVDIGAFESTMLTVFVDQHATGANDGSSWANAFTSLSQALGTVPNDDIDPTAPDVRIEVAQGTYTPNQGPTSSGANALGSIEDVSGGGINAGIDIVVTDSAVNITYPGFAFSNGDEVAVDITNLSSHPINSITLRGLVGTFGFDGDGFDANSIPTGPSGYEGPDNFFTNIQTVGQQQFGTIVFTDNGCGLPPGGSTDINTTYFALDTDTPSAVTVASVNAPATFQLANNFFIYGGYVGVQQQSNPDQRDISRFVTVLSGNVDPDSDGCVICYHVVTGSGTTSASLLDGFTITGGNANGLGTNQNIGAGIFISNGSPTIRNCAITQNTASSGAGVAVIGTSSPTFNNCIITQNTASVRGGGMYNVASSPTLNYCTFSGNIAPQGGAMYNLNASPTLNNCVFFGNSTSGPNGTGGGIFSTGSSVVKILSGSFLNNSASAGGGAIYQNSGTLTITNSQFVGNSIAVNGIGGSAIGTYGVASATIDNSTFTDNSFGGGPGHGAVLYVQDSSTATVANSIFWNDNTYNSTHPGSEYIVSWANNYGATGATVRYSDVRVSSGLFPGLNNNNADPLFVRAPNLAAGDYGNVQLTNASLCLNNGNNSDVPNGVLTDLAGNSRIVATTVDRGAFENQGTGATLPTVTQVVLGYADAGHTIVNQVTVSFNEAVNPNAFSLQKIGSAALPVYASSGNNTSFAITFPASLFAGYTGNHLMTGQFLLAINPFAGALMGGPQFFSFASS